MQNTASETKLPNTTMKYIAICGGGASGIGKGITVSSIALILKSAGFRVTVIKIDPYLNIDAGTMNPYEHGECYVLKDGGEVDLDLGNYERFLNITPTIEHNITTGKIYRKVLKKERKGDFLGKTVQVIPHITNEIQSWIMNVAEIPVDESGLTPQICLIELGGTVGDIESGPFLEAIRQLQLRVGKDNFLIFFMSYAPVLGAVGEQKSKPTQNGMKELRITGLFADFVVIRSENKLTKAVKSKVSLFGSIQPECVLSSPNVDSVYYLPVFLEMQGISKLVCSKLHLEWRKPDLTYWEQLHDNVMAIKQSEKVTKIAIVGKYIELKDAYMSLEKSLEHASYQAKVKLQINWVESEDLEDQTGKEEPPVDPNAWDVVKAADGILVPGGFGSRGIPGKILAIEYARTKKIPFLGICFGLQIAVIEFCRNVLGWKDATSEEFVDEMPGKQVVVAMPEISKTKMGGTMRCGSRECHIEDKHSLAFKIYGQHNIEERHRHRFEVNFDCVPEISKAGLTFSGVNNDDQNKGKRMEIIEIKEHPYFFGVQFHPELKSRILKPSPVFTSFVMASAGILEAKLEANGGLLNLEKDYLPNQNIQHIKHQPLILLDGVLEKDKSTEIHAKSQEKININSSNKINGETTETVISETKIESDKI
jgi:CTP synthase